MDVPVLVYYVFDSTHSIVIDYGCKILYKFCIYNSILFYSSLLRRHTSNKSLILASIHRFADIIDQRSHPISFQVLGMERTILKQSLYRSFLRLWCFEYGRKDYQATPQSHFPRGLQVLDMEGTITKQYLNRSFPKPLNSGYGKSDYKEIPLSQLPQGFSGY